ncbi:MAG: nitrogenase component 1 [Saccharofermentans sp.]|nr:nitrogenase component 1 [Saccharofermentans sp.]
MTKKAICFTAGKLAELGKENIPDELLSGKGLVYSSPATLAYNSPGAEGYGVKRAGLAVPESVMLIVAPGCCGRNTSLISNMPGYKNRFFYLEMNENDLVTGKHLARIPEAVTEIVEFLKDKTPRVVMICITCVDALLGTDMERVTRKAEEALRQKGFDKTRVRPCYMYALTREGRRPPMVHVRQTLYSLLEPMQKDPRTVNIIGNFAPLAEGELQRYLTRAGVTHIRQIGTSESYEDFLKMASANFNIVTDPEVRAAAEDMNANLNIPYIELTRVHGIDRIAKQYSAFAAATGIEIDDTEEREEAWEAVDALKERYPDLTFNIGESSNCDPFELATSLVRYGFKVDEIYATLSPERFVYIKNLARLSPDTKVYCNMEPTMIYYDMSGSKADITIGKDAGYYCPDIPNIAWNTDIKPFGYQGVRDLMNSIASKLEEGRA